ncbi:hypothetical protein SVIOM342S_06314 [Streptomyces violaceorubidus]
MPADLLAGGRRSAVRAVEEVAVVVRVVEVGIMAEIAVSVVVGLGSAAAAAGRFRLGGLGSGLRGGQEAFDGGTACDSAARTKASSKTTEANSSSDTPRSWSSSGSQPSGNGVPPTSSGTGPE